MNRVYMQYEGDSTNLYKLSAQQCKLCSTPDSAADTRDFYSLRMLRGCFDLNCGLSAVYVLEIPINNNIRVFHP